ncbi:MOSC domain-containing protein [Marinomonas posidonica]|uniref:MOSC domain containing protein n=1 Tax=Marinomonas posidonica (strain CECT 7376 / NCIMB 14433 / IVIA-Po-181) TaxID=491952 RepID=F6D0M2_MARPP|nr:MOSC N-terminal beta barrel domain-containing protein [Marinomonas posidonica]AEF54820.1 MOSC domain containing protein [Marinomonas posidonica IVIA-Po-181]
MVYSLSDLVIYPIKSIHGIHKQQAQVGFSGLEDDRCLVLVKPNGDVITGRKYPELTRIQASKNTQNQWLLKHPDHSQILTLDATMLTEEYRLVTIWNNAIQAQSLVPEVDQWFSELLGETIHLAFFGQESKRHTNRRPNSPVAFADGYPFLLTTEASLEELNRSCPESIQMAQFRPNMVVKGGKAFEEDTWKRIRIGEVEFENVQPCVRCIFATLNPDTGIRSRKGEPLKTLGKFRLLKNEGITFGLNLIALNTGLIQQGDEVEILEYQEADQYIDKR